MQLCKFLSETNEIGVGIVADGEVLPLDLARAVGIRTLSDILYSDDPVATAEELRDEDSPRHAVAEVDLLAPLDSQEVWAAGVTYIRSRQARMEESEHAATFYDRVYEADRPELFLKATPHRVVGPGGRVRIRSDSKWSVPEPELALVLSPRLELVGFTIGNDMSARDIEGENPLYLPQAKVYDQCCAIGPVVTLAPAMPPREETTITLRIERMGLPVFEGTVSVGQMARSFEDLISWLGRDNSFPNGVILLTGTGIVPPDEFTLEQDDIVQIDVTGIGTLTNIVEQRTANNSNRPSL